MGVEVTKGQRSQRAYGGSVELATPVSHIWYFKNHFKMVNHLIFHQEY